MAFSLGASAGRAARAAPVPFGDYLIADQGPNQGSLGVNDGAILRVNPATGSQGVVASGGLLIAQ